MNDHAENTRLAAMPMFAWTGSHMINVLSPDPDHFVLSEIARGLSRENRYGGAATSVPWSVCQHSLTCDHYAEQDGQTSREERLVIIMHDAPEYMLRDIISPVKRFLPEYKAMEKVWWNAMAQKFGMPYAMPPVVKHYDMLTAASEKLAFIDPRSGDWPGVWPEARPIPDWIAAMTRAQAEAAFIDRVTYIQRTVTLH